MTTVLGWMWAWCSAQWEEFKWGLEQFHLCALWTRLRSLVTHVLPPCTVRRLKGEIVQLWPRSTRLFIPWEDILSECLWLKTCRSTADKLLCALSPCPTGGSVRPTVRKLEKQHLSTLFTLISLTCLWNYTFTVTFLVLLDHVCMLLLLFDSCGLCDWHVREGEGLGISKLLSGDNRWSDGFIEGFPKK